MRGGLTATLTEIGSVKELTHVKEIGSVKELTHVNVTPCCLKTRHIKKPPIGYSFCLRKIS